MTTLATGNPAVLAHRCDWEDRTVLAVHNFAGEARTVTIELGEIAIEESSSELKDLLTPRPVPSISVGNVELDLEPTTTGSLRDAGPWIGLG